MAHYSSSSVVLAEVVIGIANAASREGAVHAVSAGTVVVAPSADDWTRAGMAVAQLGGEAVTKSRSFWNDAILAAQCARLGVTLLTHNAKDFQRLGRHSSACTPWRRSQSVRHADARGYALDASRAASDGRRG